MCEYAIFNGDSMLTKNIFVCWFISLSYACLFDATIFSYFNMRFTLNVKCPNTACMSWFNHLSVSVTRKIGVFSVQKHEITFL